MSVSTDKEVRNYGQDDGSLGPEYSPYFVYTRLLLLIYRSDGLTVVAEVFVTAPVALADANVEGLGRGVAC